MGLWKPIDWLARWLGDHMTAHNQLRLGILLVLGSLPLYGYAPFSGEPPIIYVMSALALTLTGVGIVVGAEVLTNQEDEKADPGPGSAKS